MIYLGKIGYYRVTKFRFKIIRAERLTYEDVTISFARGTGGSNPPSSSGESAANSTFMQRFKYRAATKSEFDKRRRRVAALQFMVQQDAAAQGQRPRMVSDFGGAAIRDVADEDVAACQRLAVGWDAAFRELCAIPSDA